LNILDEVDDELRTDYIRFLFGLYILETEDGFDMGVYPTYEQFLQIREEEACYH